MANTEQIIAQAKVIGTSAANYPAGTRVISINELETLLSAETPTKRAKAMSNTNMQLGEWLIKQDSNGDIVVVQNQDGSGVVVKSGSDDIVTHIFHWFLSDALLVNAAQPEAWRAVKRGAGGINGVIEQSAIVTDKAVAEYWASLKGGEIEAFYTAPPTSAVAGFKARLIARLNKLEYATPKAALENAYRSLREEIERGDFDKEDRDNG